MSVPTAEVVICGAGIAGVAAAYHLAVRRGIHSVILVDERPPLSLTSDKSAESYRNWWPGPGDDMAALMNRSIDLMEELARESDNVFLMNRRGYLFATAQPGQIEDYVKAAEDAAARGVGPLRLHRSAGGDYQPSPATGYEGQPSGTDVVTDRSLIRRHFPYLAEDTVALLHARRCGWFSGQQLGMYMLERAREAGVRLTEGRVDAVETAGGRVTGVRVSGGGGRRTIGTPRFVNAVGPHVKAVGRLLDVEIPVFCERHAKVAFHDTQGVVPRHAPMMIWTDPVRLPWSDDEREELGQAEGLRHFLDGGYYTKTEENRLLSGPLPVEGAYVLGGLSGYGMMSSNGAADLLADYIAERPLPRYAPAFRLDRYRDPAYRTLLAEWGDSGQL